MPVPLQRKVLLSKRIFSDAWYLRCMGTTAGNKALEVDYPLAFGDAFSKFIQKKFWYIHLSGAATERDQSRSLWFKSEMRKLKGASEISMLSFSKEGSWGDCDCQGGYIVSEEATAPRDMLGYVLGDKMSIRMDELAAYMVSVALKGGLTSTVSDCEVMLKKG
ncbi:hypothetical protein B0O99DRAFT_614308 [Bisporella sp. PMI_857]|nr:hypothetical protein B0O99DRAFT_614308 [Bisporella sp. PMI_857]